MSDVTMTYTGRAAASDVFALFRRLSRLILGHVQTADGRTLCADNKLQWNSLTFSKIELIKF
jgi:hypothetical protein